MLLARRSDAGYLMLVEDPAFSGDNIRIITFNIQYPETSIQYRYALCLKAILKLVLFVNFLGMKNG